MMRWPALLTAKLVQTGIVRIFKSQSASFLMQVVDPAEILHSTSAAPVSREKMQSLVESSAPLIWIGGSEPLAHPGIAHFVRAIAQSRHWVFLETNGTLLRRRIHEFQPLPQLFLTVRLDTLQTSESRLAFEGLRAARLSGFFTAIHTRIRDHLALSELEPLCALVMENELDGWLITAGSPDSPVARKAGEARNLLPSVFWRRFSQLVEHELLLQVKVRESQGTCSAAKPSSGACEESERVA